MKYFYNDKTGKALELEDDSLKIEKLKQEPHIVEINKHIYRKLSSLNTITSMIDKYGEDTQIDVAIEEMSELIKELIKYKRAKVHQSENNPRREFVLEEMGDVLFMIEYLKFIFTIEDSDIDDIIIKKSKRTAERYL